MHTTPVKLNYYLMLIKDSRKMQLFQGHVTRRSLKGLAEMSNPRDKFKLRIKFKLCIYFISHNTCVNYSASAEAIDQSSWVLSTPSPVSPPAFLQNPSFYAAAEKSCLSASPLPGSLNAKGLL